MCVIILMDEEQVQCLEYREYFRSITVNVWDIYNFLSDSFLTVSISLAVENEQRSLLLFLNSE